MKRADVIIIGAVLLAALALFIITSSTRDKATAAIYVGNELYKRVSLADYASITIDQGDGKVNVVTIDENGVRMESSTCKNQLCVKRGAIAPSDELLLENWIICLPNGVSVELEAGE